MDIDLDAESALGGKALTNIDGNDGFSHLGGKKKKEKNKRHDKQIKIDGTDNMKDEDDEDVDMAIKSVHNASSFDA